MGTPIRPLIQCDGGPNQQATIQQILAESFGYGISGQMLASGGPGVEPSLKSTGLVITQHTSPITTDVDGATVTFDLSASDWHQVTLGGNRTLALSNETVGQQFTLYLVQDGTGSRTATWFTTIKWAGGVAPTLTTTASKGDLFTFKVMSAGNYLGMVCGQNF